ncbi:hypothetical protein M422DRAFT_36545, partial [Sphaerobolus stellatus SS14]
SSGQQTLDARSTIPAPLASDPSPRERRPSNLSSLNPSAPRFVLSMPLLGRAKVPLGKVIGVIPIASNDNAPNRSEGNGGQAAVAESSSRPEPHITNGLEKEAVHLTEATASDVIPETSNSWWAYLGLVSATSSRSFENSSPSTPTTLQSPIIISPARSPIPHSALPASVTETQLVSNNSVQVPGRSTASILSAESALWMPWRWLGTSNVNANNLESTSEAGSGIVLVDGKTEAELVKEEAMSRAEAQDAQSNTPQQSDTDLPPAKPNPVLNSIETRTGWLSVFASASVKVRGLKEEGEVMEVMSVEEEEIGEVTTQQPAADPMGSFAKPSEADSTLPSKKASSLKAPSEDSPRKPLTSDKDLRKRVSQSSGPEKSPRDKVPNLVLPTFEDTFATPPRSVPFPKAPSSLRRTMRYLSGFVFPDDEKNGGSRKKGKEREVFGQHLPRLWGMAGEDPDTGLKDIKRVVVVGIHGWFPGALMRSVLGEPTGTSTKFATMMANAVQEYFEQRGIELEKVTKIILEGEGTIEHRVNILFQEWQNHKEWIEDLQSADAILFATHSQGSIVTTHLVDRLINDGHIRTPKTNLLDSVLSRPAQKVIVLALCGIHNGPLRYLNTSSIVNPYLQYFESAAARELFDFQDSESLVSKAYVTALGNALQHEVKFTYIASMNDQVVPIYSGVFTTAGHPLILRALYIDGDAYSSSDFLSNLLVLLFKIRNAGLDDGGLITHLSEATAGSLSGVGHSTAYEEPATYALAVRFLFETTGTLGHQPDLAVQPFTARAARNDYEIPWALRDLIAHPDVETFFSSEFSELRAAFDQWHPRTTALREIRRKLEPIRRLPISRL